MKGCAHRERDHSLRTCGLCQLTGARDGIRVNALCLGYVETALIGRYMNNPMIAKALLTQTPLRRFGTPQDIANAALFLASDEAAYITGQSVLVDGGLVRGL